MTARKKLPKVSSDTRVASIVLGLFAAAVILFFIVSKAKEHAKETVTPVNEAVERYLPETVKPAENLSKPIKPQLHPKLSGKGGMVAIILDDWGQSTANCAYLEQIPEPLAVSILPGLRHTKDVAACAKESHKLAMLHLPLEALHNYDLYPPNYVIKTTMSPSLVTQIVQEDLDQLPSVEGVNNHMGSKATADKPLMKIILKILKGRNLFFIDSVTSRYTVSAQLADAMGLRFGKRDVFLDNINTREAIIQQIIVLAQKARRNGYAVAIGHDRHLTMQVLKEEIPWMEKQGIRIVSIKDLLQQK